MQGGRYRASPATFSSTAARPGNAHNLYDRHDARQQAAVLPGGDQRHREPFRAASAPPERTIQLPLIRAQGAGRRAQGAGRRAQGAGRRAQGAGRRAQGAGQQSDSHPGYKPPSPCQVKKRGTYSGLPRSGTARLRCWSSRAGAARKPATTDCGCQAQGATVHVVLLH